MKNRIAVPLLRKMTFTYWSLTTPSRILRIMGIKDNIKKRIIHLGLTLTNY